jgi:hypothetical protein
MLILVPIAFAAGVITAFTPCILPVLPIVLAGGAGAETGGRMQLPRLINDVHRLPARRRLAVGPARHQCKAPDPDRAALLLALALTLIVPKVGELVERPSFRHSPARWRPAEASSWARASGSYSSHVAGRCWQH